MLRQTLSRLAMLVLAAPLALAQVGQFVEAPQFATGVNPQAVAAGDFNSDGKLDLVVANTTSNTISVLLGKGDGTFGTNTDYTTGTTPQGVAVGDFNGDGHPDVAVTDSASNTVSIFLGNGDGTFKPKKDFPTGKKPWGIAVADFNADGNQDIVVTNAQDGTVGVMLGNGDGTFKAQVARITGFNPFSVVAVDLDKDGVLDLAVACNVNTNIVSVLLGNGDGTFASQLQFTVGSDPYSITAADFNNDGFPDLAIANQQGNSVSLLLSNGSAKGHGWNLVASAPFPTGAFPTGVAAGDFNGDGNMDVAVSNGNGNSISILLGNGDGTFQPQTSIGSGDIPFNVIAADLNGDHKTDLVVANSGGGNVSAILGNGNGTFQTRIDYAAGPNPYSVATGDFNRDGFLDLAVANSNCPSTPCGPGTVSIVLGNGDGTFQPPVSYSTGNETNPRSIAVGDFNGDKVSDLVVANYATGTVSVFLGVGDGTFDSHVDYRVGELPDAVAVGDLNGDGKIDIVVANFQTDTISVLLGNGDGTFKGAVSYAVGSEPISVALGDFNGDKKVDLVVVNENDNNVTILLGNGDGTFTALAATPNVGGNPQDVVVGDFNSDGALDLAVADFKASQVSVLLGNGDGSFRTAVPFQTGANPASIVSADFNNDGKLDLAVTSTPLGNAPGNLVSLLLGNGDGTFQPFSLFSAGYLAYSSIVGDFNGDKALDLAVANGSSNTVSLLINAQGTKMTLHSSGNPSVSGQSVTFAITVNASVAEAGVPSGTVTVKSGNTVVGSGPISGGQVVVSTSALPVGADLISAVYGGDGHFQAHTVTMTQQVTASPDFTIAVGALSPGSVTPPASATSTVTVTPLNGMDVSGVALTCSVTPAVTPAATCSIGSMSISGGVGTSTLTVSTAKVTQTAMAQPAGKPGQAGGLFALGLIVPALLLGVAGVSKQNRGKVLSLCLVFLVLSGCAFQVACGGGNGGNGGGTPPPTTTSTPAGQYTVVVMGTAGTLQHAAAPMTLTVQ